MSNRPKVELKGEKAREFIKKVVALSESNNAAAQHYGYEAGVLEGILRNKGKITAQDVESVICDAISQIGAGLDKLHYVGLSNGKKTL